MSIGDFQPSRWPNGLFLLWVILAKLTYQAFNLSLLFLLQVTFSQVVDQMACSFSESSSLSDLSSCTEDFKHSVSSHVPSSRRGPRKLMRSNRLSKRVKKISNFYLFIYLIKKWLIFLFCFRPKGSNNRLEAISAVPIL